MVGIFIHTSYNTEDNTRHASWDEFPSRCSRKFWGAYTTKTVASEISRVVSYHFSPEKKLLIFSRLVRVLMFNTSVRGEVGFRLLFIIG